MSRLIGLLVVLGVARASAEEPAELVAQALAARPELAAAEARARAERQTVPQAEAFADPVLTVGIQNDGFDRIAIGEMETSFLSIMLSQALPWPGKRAARGRVATLAADRNGAVIARVRLSTEAEVRRAYIDLLLARDRLALLGNLGEVLQRSQEIARTRYEVAAGPQSDILRAQLEQTRLRQRRLTLEAEERVAVQALNRLRGRPLDEAIATQTSVRDLAVPAGADDPADAEARSPELLAVRLEGRRAGAAVDLARKEQYPDFAVSAGVMPRGSLEPMWTASVSITLPIFRARRSAAVAQARAENEAAGHDVEAVARTLRQRVAERQAALLRLREIIRLYHEGLLVQSSATVESTLSQYRVGKVTFASVLEAVVGHVGDEDAYLQALAEAQRVAIAGAEVSLEPAEPSSMGRISP